MDVPQERPQEKEGRLPTDPGFKSPEYLECLFNDSVVGRRFFHGECSLPVGYRFSVIWVFNNPLGELPMNSPVSLGSKIQPNHQRYSHEKNNMKRIF
jgi:hypothetical protein